MIELSICYPTYNRKHVLYNNIMHVLEYQGDEIEVVVSDNCSTDGTREMVLEIEDPRVKYFCNSYNNGYDNFFSVLKRAEGRFAMLVSDEDCVFPNELPQLLEQLKNKTDFGLIRVSTLIHGKPYYSFEDEIKEAGFDSINRIFGHSYVSGYVFNSEFVKKAFCDERYTYIENSNYPHLLLSILVLEKGKLFTSNLILLDHLYDEKKDPNVEEYYENNKRKSLKSPEGEMIFCKKRLDVLNQIKLDNYEKTRLLVRVILSICYYSSVTWLSILSSERSIKDYMIDSMDLKHVDKKFASIIKEVTDVALDYSQRIGFAKKEWFYDCITSDDEWREYYENSMRNTETEYNKYVSILNNMM